MSLSDNAILSVTLLFSFALSFAAGLVHGSNQVAVADVRPAFI
jgi:hypothetical protein